MHVREYQEHFYARRSVVVPEDSLVGRVLRGKTEKDFTTLTDDPDRKLVLLTGPDGLQSFLGKTHWEILLEIGYRPGYARGKLREGYQFKLLVFKAVAAQLATTENVLDFVCATYPDVANKVEPWRSILVSHFRTYRETPLIGCRALENMYGCHFSVVELSGKNDPRYMTHERFRISAGTLADLRAFLYFTLHLREPYRGDGYTLRSGGGRGVTEYIIPNQLIASVGGILLPMNPMQP